MRRLSQLHRVPAAPAAAVFLAHVVVALLFVAWAQPAAAEAQSPEFLDLRGSTACLTFTGMPGCDLGFSSHDYCVKRDCGCVQEVLRNPRYYPRKYFGVRESWRAEAKRRADAARAAYGKWQAQQAVVNSASATTSASSPANHANADNNAALRRRRRLQRARAAYTRAMSRYADAMHEYQRLLLQDGFVVAANRAEFDRALAWLGADKVAQQARPGGASAGTKSEATAGAGAAVAAEKEADNELAPISPPEPPVIGRTESEQQRLDGARNQLSAWFERCLSTHECMVEFTVPPGPGTAAQPSSKQERQPVCATGRIETVYYWGDGSVAPLPYKYEDLYSKKPRRGALAVSASSSARPKGQSVTRNNLVPRKSTTTTTTTAKTASGPTKQESRGVDAAQSSRQQQSEVKEPRESPVRRHAREGILEHK